MAFAVKILADSITAFGERLTTFEATFPRIVLAEVNTHRMLSKSSASSRAIPVSTKIAQVVKDPFVPAVFVKNQKGMQGAAGLDDGDAALAEHWWRRGAAESVVVAEGLAASGLHKALANRVVEPYAWHTAILSGTDWPNFWHLRVNPDAQGEFRSAAEMMLACYEQSVPRPLNDCEWHLPLVSAEERIESEQTGSGIARLAKISVARCARVSYLTHAGVRDQEEDLTLYARLASAGHLSPLEHVARPMGGWEREAFEQFEAEFWVEGGTRTLRVSRQFIDRVQAYDYPRLRLTGEPRPVYYCGNYNGWVQHRKLVPGEADVLGYRATAAP